VFSSEKGQQVDPHSVQKKKTNYPVFNIIDKTAKEVSLTRNTILSIFKGLSEEKKKYIFRNPEGFTTIFINKIKGVLADQIAENIEYYIEEGFIEIETEDVFPENKKFPQKELIEADSKSLYDFIQIDSEIERNFVEKRLKDDDKIVLYFKFPNLFRINLPKIIGNYNPDWGIIRIGIDGKLKLQLVRETKGSSDPNKLRFDNEKRKILCADKHFKALSINYKQIKGTETDIWDENLITGFLENK
ncbi:MAG: type III restriction endonuclease subunit R, partial [Candidatus Sericytochromatia bacterium]